MKIRKYIISISILAAVTFAVLCLPGFYFRNYRFGMVIEDMEQYSYDGLVSSNANAWQIYSMLGNGNYTSTEVYSRISSDEQQNEKMDAIYIEMVSGVFQKYLKMEENLEGISQDKHVIGESEVEMSESINLSDYIKEWLVEKDEWQVVNVQLFNLKNIFDSRLVNVRLYLMTLQFFDGEVFMNIYFNPDYEFFYGLYLADWRYAWELIDEANLRDELYNYYRYSAEEMDSVSEEDWYRLQDIMQINLVPGELMIGMFTM